MALMGRGLLTRKGGTMLRDLRGGLPGILALTALTGLLALGGYLIFDAQWLTFGFAHARP